MKESRSCTPFPLWFGSKGRHVANLGVAIVRLWREIGIGTVLVASLLEWAIRLSYLKASIEVIGTNQRVINLFNKFGFVDVTLDRDLITAQLKLE